MPARPAVPALGRTSPIRRARHESLSAQTAQPSPQTPIAVKIVQTGDPADHQNPSRQREKRQGENFRLIGAGLQEAAIVPASGEEAQKGVGVNAGGGIDERLGLVVAGGAQLQLSPVKPAGGRVGLLRRINRASCGCGLNGMRLHRPCFCSGNRRGPDEDRGGMRVDERGSCRTCGLHRQNRRQRGGQNRDDDKASQVDPHSPGARANPTPGRSRDRRMGTLTKKYNKNYAYWLPLLPRGCRYREGPPWRRSRRVGLPIAGPVRFAGSRRAAIDRRGGGQRSTSPWPRPGCAGRR
jgi:hypothetical protein